MLYIYDQPNNDSFCNKMESVQYNAALAITGAIKGSSRERLYQELGTVGKSIFSTLFLVCNSPEYLRSLHYSYNHARGNLFRNYKTNTEYFKNSFFRYCVEEWNKLGHELNHAVSISKFKKKVFLLLSGQK